MKIHEVRRRVRRAPSRRWRGPTDRLSILARYRAWHHPLAAVRWLLLDPETTNFTYEIDNEAELAAFVAAAYSLEHDLVAAYLRELAEDTELHTRLTARLGRMPGAKPRPLFGRRAGWYAIVRLAQPELAVETGVHNGLGSAAILRALERNAAEGHEGRLVSFDIDPRCGGILDEELRDRWEFVQTSSRDVFTEWVRASDEPVSFFVHDSDHSLEHESFELETFWPRFAPGAAVLTDNPGGPAFADFCNRHGLEYSVFWEQPVHHFYPGAGIGIALLPGN